MAKKDIPTSKLTLEIGTTGLNRWGGEVYQEFLPELRGKRGQKIYEEMRSNDPIIGAALFAIGMTIKSVKFSIESVSGSKEDLEAANFLDENREDMSHTWDDFLDEVLTFLPFGYSYFEQVYKLRKGKDANPSSLFNDGRIGWRKFAFRAQDTLDRWEFDETGGIKGMWQFSLFDSQYYYIPISKAILFRTTKEKNNPEGRSALRTAYRPWYYKTNLEIMEGISLERRGAGLPVMKLPEGASEADVKVAKSTVRKVRVDEQMGLTLPFGWDFDFKAPTADLMDFRESITRYRNEMLMSVLAQFITLGLDKFGSYALSKDHKSFFLNSLTGWVNNITETFNKYAVAPLFNYNNFSINKTPKLVHRGLNMIDLEVMVKYLEPLINLGLIEPDPNLEQFLRDIANLPDKVTTPVKKKRLLAKQRTGIHVIGKTYQN